MALNVATLDKKYERPRETHRSGLTIWDVPGAGLYRVLEINRGEFIVETLALPGWITLMTFGAFDNLPNAETAMQTWLDIQTPTEPPTTEEENT